MSSHSHPWNIRSVSVKHHQFYGNILDLHELTASWLRDLKVDPETEIIPRGLNQNATDHLWVFDSLSGTRLESLLDDTDPSEMLQRLEQSVTLMQAWALQNLMDRVSNEEKKILVSRLEQSSWKAGKSCAEVRHSKTIEEFKDLRNVTLLLADLPVFIFGAPPTLDRFLLRRVTNDHVEFEVRNCPHQNQSMDAIADVLCEMQVHWLRGYFYVINNKTVLDHSVCGKNSENSRCVQRWTIGN